MQTCCSGFLPKSKKKWFLKKEILTGGVFFLTAYSGFLILLTLNHKNLCRSVKRWGRRWNRQRVTGIPILPCKFGVKLIPIRLWTSSDSNLEEGTGYVLRWGMTDRRTGRDLATKATSLKKYTGASQFKPFAAVETHDANEEPLP